MPAPNLGGTVGRGHRRGEQGPLRSGQAGHCTLSHVTELLCLSGQVSLFFVHKTFLYTPMCPMLETQQKQGRHVSVLKHTVSWGRQTHYSRKERHEKKTTSGHSDSEDALNLSR